MAREGPVLLFPASPPPPPCCVSLSWAPDTLQAVPASSQRSQLRAGPSRAGPFLPLPASGVAGSPRLTDPPSSLCLIFTSPLTLCTGVSVSSENTRP